MRWSWLLLLAACDGSNPLFGDSPEPTPCAGVELSVLEDAILPPANVSARVAVTRCDGAPLGATLSPTDFTLLEDGSPLSDLEAKRAITPIRRDTLELVLVLLDLSGSVTSSGLRRPMIDGARALVDRLDGRRKVAVFGFDGRPDLVPFTHFTADRDALEAALARAETAPLVDESTNLNGALVSSLRVLDEAIATEAKDFTEVAAGSLVVFTDGGDQAHRVSDLEADATLARTPHEVFAIGLGDAELDRIGKSGAFRAGEDSIGAAFEAAAARLADRASVEYLVSYCSPSRAGDHVLEVKALTDLGTGLARVSFVADGFGGGCSPDASPLR